MSKEYHYVIKWTDEDGWHIDPDTEDSNFPEGTIYDTEEGWQFGYLGDGKYNGKELELTDTLTSALEMLNGATL